MQNYPNPFNPSTTIEFVIGQSSLVSIAIVDLLGQEVAVLANDVKNPGTYTVSWDATGFASGVYFYRLKAGSFVETRKLVVAR
jgi:hypothetical protein